MDMKTRYSDGQLLDLLGRRVGEVHLRQRLGMESEGGQHVFGYGRNFFHIENWYSIHALIRNALRLSLLHGRGRRNARALRVRHHPLAISGLPGAFEGFRILQLSDLHIDVDREFADVLIRRLQGVEWDLCVITGDFRYRTHGDFAEVLAAMARLRPHLGPTVYAILGNHDSIRMVPPLEALGIRFLLNESQAVCRGEEVIHIAGIDDPHYYRVDNLERARRGIPVDAVSILLAHSPEIYRQAAHAGFDAMFCGHTHGGQIRLPGGIPLLTNAKCPRCYCAGPWRHHGLQGYTSLGTGSSVVDVRFNCPPEVTVHELRAPQAATASRAVQ